MDEDETEIIEIDRLISTEQFSKILVQDLSDNQARVLLSTVRKVVPKKRDKHQMLSQERYMTVSEVAERLKYSPDKCVEVSAAAEILELGELEAMVEGMQKPSHDWEELVEKIKNQFSIITSELSDPPENDDSEHSQNLSQKNLLNYAENHFEELTREMRSAAAQATDPKDLEYITELVSSVAYSAFHTSWNLMAAVGKEHEPSALAWEKQMVASAEGAAQLRNATKENNAEEYAVIDKLVGLYPSDTKAARALAKELQLPSDEKTVERLRSRVRRRRAEK